jgi:hypothetical protein
VDPGGAEDEAMKAQWFLVTGRLYRYGRDRSGEPTREYVLVVDDRVVTPNAILGLHVGDPWLPGSLPDGVEVFDLEKP